MSVSSVSNAGAAAAAMMAVLNNQMQADMSALAAAVQPDPGTSMAINPDSPGGFDTYA
ncbi:MAG TPA: hypothetical protein V6D47_21775 [Oscillatoriaceae cyanobacterium]